MVEAVSQLPSNATAWENAHDLTDATRWLGLDIEAIRRAKDPLACEPRFLPLLAWERSVDVWSSTWPLEKQRYVVENWYDFERAKGTVFGARRFLRLAGATYIRAIRPPDKTFLGKSFTDAERRAWLARFQQIRIYPYAERAQQQFKSFTTAAYGLKKAFLGRIYPYDAATYSRYRRAAFLFEPRDGSLTSIEHRTVQRTTLTGQAIAVQEVILPAIPSRAIYLGARPGRRFFGDPGLRRRVVTIRTPLAYGYTLEQAQITTVAPSLDPVDIRPTMVRETGQRRIGAQFLGDCLAARFLPRSTADRRIYEMIHLHDPDRLPDGRPRTTHLRATRLGHQAKTAKIRAQVPGHRSRFAAGRFSAGFLVPRDGRNLTEAMEALQAWKSARDLILLTPKHMRRPRVGDRITVGQLKVGQLVPA